ncbi:recombinase family protein [Streptomyces sp. NPDC046832]|uniref:recombinase family protein n=1 Tax=Streptomyces sp. NPDC046832 TaxID=3155020 RepID=UPI0034001F1A
MHPLIAARDAVLTRDYTDNDKSAYTPEVFREDFEAWLQDFIDDNNDGIAAWDLDRVFRQNTGLERVIKAYCDAFFKQRCANPVLWLPSLTKEITAAMHGTPLFHDTERTQSFLMTGDILMLLRDIEAKVQLLPMQT